MIATFHGGPHDGAPVPLSSGVEVKMPAFGKAEVSDLLKPLSDFHGYHLYRWDNKSGKHRWVGWFNGK